MAPDPGRGKREISCAERGDPILITERRDWGRVQSTVQRNLHSERSVPPSQSACRGGRRRKGVSHQEADRKDRRAYTAPEWRVAVSGLAKSGEGKRFFLKNRGNRCDNKCDVPRIVRKKEGKETPNLCVGYKRGTDTTIRRRSKKDSKQTTKVQEGRGGRSRHCRQSPQGEWRHGSSAIHILRCYLQKEKERKGPLIREESQDANAGATLRLKKGFFLEAEKRGKGESRRVHSALQGGVGG